MTLQGRTAVHEAADHGKFVCLTYLLQHGAVCKTRDRSGITPLMLSAQVSTFDLSTHFLFLIIIIILLPFLEFLFF